MKKILLVAYHFPPDASVGALRPAKFAKYLPQFGWDPIILTVKEKYYPAVDHSRLRDVAGVRQIHRTRTLFHLSRAYVRLKSLFRGRTPHADPETAQDSRPKVGTSLSFSRRLFLSLECLPDGQQGWIPVATTVGLNLIAREKVEAIFSSGPPMTCHVIGFLLKVATGRRWIADFRDPWLTHRGNFVPSTAASRAVEGWLERKVLTSADQIVLTTERMQADLHQRHPGIMSKTTVILNGYDPPDFDGAGLVPQYRANRDDFILTHGGTMYYKRTAESFLVGVANLINRGELPRARVRVNFIGLSPGVQERSRQLGIDDVVRVLDAMDYHSYIERLHCSDVLLLFAQGQPLQIPTKFYEYIAVGKPILVFAEDGATADLARRLRAPIIVRPDDRGGVEGQLMELYNDFKSNALGARGWSDEGLRSALTKMELTKRLVNLIN